MPGTGVGLFFIDFLFRPFAKIMEKMPIVMIGFLILLYAGIAYVVLRSAYMAEER
jgi:F0F1-type ATP synthase assembly protein I